MIQKNIYCTQGAREVQRQISVYWKIIDNNDNDDNNNNNKNDNSIA